MTSRKNVQALHCFCACTVTHLWTTITIIERMCFCLLLLLFSAADAKSCCFQQKMIRFILNCIISAKQRGSRTTIMFFATPK